MRLSNSTIFVTGANRGIGRAFVDELLVRGAAKIYAAARDTSAIIEDPRITPITLDITDGDAVEHTAAAVGDVNVLINNAGVTTFAPIVKGRLTDIRLEMETNYFGTLSMVRAFAPVLASNGGGGILNVSSAAAWFGMEHSSGYAASKAAVWAMSNGLRVELRPQNTQVTGLHMASTDTAMIASLDVPKNTPQAVAIAALDGFEAGELEVLADDDTRAVKATLSANPVDVYPQAVRHK